MTVPGPISNQGCPEEQSMDHSVIAKDVELALREVLFVFDKTEIIPESFAKLDQAAKAIKASNGGTFLLTGNTDKKGNENYNLDLSRRRARAVMLELEKRGVNPNQLKSRGLGSKNAVVPVTASNEERQSDRKVTVEYITGAEWKALPKSDVE